jgi:hypothetical protein
MNLNPDYQRDVVWSESRMTHLLDSLFRNFYVPPVIFKVTTGVKPGTNERRRWRICIDGKQRLTTIKRFFDGEIPYIDDRKRKWYYCDVPGGSTRRILPPEEKEFIDNVNIVNIEFEGLKEDQEEDMFQRVQLGVSLTVAEKLAGLSGEIPDYINSLRASCTALVHLVGTTRSTDFRFVTTLLYLIHEQIREDEDLKLAVSFPTLKKFLCEEPRRILTQEFRKQVERVFTKYNDLVAAVENKPIFTHTYGPVGAKMRRFSPVEFLAAGILINTHIDRPSRALAGDIEGLREFLRSHFHDLRSNTQTWDVVMEYITTLEQTRGYYAPDEEEGRAQKRAKVHLPMVSPTKNPQWNPPPENGQISVQPFSIYNDRQQQLRDAHVAQEQAEQESAFQRIPPARPLANQTSSRSAARPTAPASTSSVRTRPPQSRGGRAEEVNHYSRKRDMNGVQIKQE